MGSTTLSVLVRFCQQQQIINTETRVHEHCNHGSSATLLSIQKETVDNFVFGAFQNLDQVLQGVRLALDIKYAALYTVEARPIYEPSALEDDQRILVAASAEETMLPDAPPGWVLYHGEEGDDVDPDTEGYGQEWGVSTNRHLHEGEVAN